MGHNPGQELLAACAAQAAKRIQEASPQSLCNTLWGFAKLQYNPGDALLAACSAQALERMQEKKPQELANMVWNFATLQHHPGAALLRSFEAAAVRSAAAFKPQDTVCDALRWWPRLEAVHLQHALVDWQSQRTPLIASSAQQAPCIPASLQGRAVRSRSMKSLTCVVRGAADVSACICVACKLLMWRGHKLGGTLKDCCLLSLAVCSEKIECRGCMDHDPNIILSRR